MFLFQDNQSVPSVLNPSFVPGENPPQIYWHMMAKQVKYYLLQRVNIAYYSIYISWGWIACRWVIKVSTGIYVILARLVNHLRVIGTTIEYLQPPPCMPPIRFRYIQNGLNSRIVQDGTGWYLH